MNDPRPDNPTRQDPPAPSPDTAPNRASAAAPAEHDVTDDPDFPEIHQMSAAAQQFVDTFDFAAAQRFIRERALQVQREVRSYAVALGVLIVAGTLQHILRHPTSIGTLDRTDGAFGVLFVLLAGFAARRWMVLTQLPAGAAHGAQLQRLQAREAGRVKRERTLAAATILLFVAALLLLAVDSMLDGAWLFAAAFVALAIGAGSTLRIYGGARAQRRAERYIRGEIPSADYTTGKQPGLKSGAPSES